jgi:type I restriction enzyme M protein
MTSTSNITRNLWRLADEFRGHFSAQTVAEITASLFFLKRITDLAEERRLHELPLNLSPKLRLFLHDFSWEKLISGDVVSALSDFLRELEKECQDLPGLSSASQLAQTLAGASGRAEVFREALRHLLDLRTHGLTAAETANVFQGLIDRMEDQAACSVTPESVRTLLAKLLSPQGDETIADAAAGYTSLICALAQESEAASGKKPRVFGQDINSGTLVLGRMNTILNGLIADLKTGDTLREPQHASGSSLTKFDVVVAHPPFGLKVGNLRADRHSRFDPATATSELAFLQHVIASLSPQGRAAILVPEGVLFRVGSFRKVREKLIRRGQLVAVIKLPPQLFRGTPIPAVVLLLRQGDPGKISPIVFVDLTVYSEGTKIRHVTGAGIEMAVRSVRDHVPVPGVSTVAFFSEVERHGFDLSILRYVRPVSDGLELKFDEEFRLFELSRETRDASELIAVAHVRALAKMTSGTSSEGKS